MIRDAAVRRAEISRAAMRVGAFYFPTDYGIAIDELARELEARGFESLWLPEHTHFR
jgi:alkanesulfonate monooxygenase SsuD/methylene tetrahydromethanopterin reductase-like flavin-dependent oxidoreductase (luciferase family)